VTGRPTLAGGVYLVTDTALCGGFGVVATMCAVVDGGVRIVQIRDKTASDSDLYELVLRAAEAVGDRALLLVNDRVDVFVAARAAGAAVHGVHLGQSDMSPLQVRRIVGVDAVIGLTTNTAAHIAALHRLPDGTVDYLGVGVIRPSTTKPDHPPPLGIVGFESLARSTSLPCVAIGGITVADLPILRGAGAAGAAVVSAICGAPNPRATTEALIAAWDQ
jgi:thiamine-phosphate pyrophosphorylase